MGAVLEDPPPPPQATQNAVILNIQRNLANAFMLLVHVWQQPGDLGVLRGVVEGVAEEARTRGFPSSPFGGFGYIVAATKYSRNLPNCSIVNGIGIYTGSSNVRSDQVLGGPIDR